MSASNPATESIVRMMMHMYETTEQYRKENSALKEMLLKRGFTLRRPGREMNATLGSQNRESDGDQQFAELFEEMKDLVRQSRVNQALLAKIPVSGKPH